MSYLVSALASVWWGFFLAFFPFFVCVFFVVGSMGLPDDVIPCSPEEALTAQVIPTVVGAPHVLAS